MGKRAQSDQVPYVLGKCVEMRRFYSPPPVSLERVLVLQSSEHYATWTKILEIKVLRMHIVILYFFNQSYAHDVFVALIGRCETCLHCSISKRQRKNKLDFKSHDVTPPSNNPSIYVGLHDRAFLIWETGMLWFEADYLTVPIKWEVCYEDKILASVVITNFGQEP